ncbi:MAG TPA: rhodanese-like domain-containing protein [Pyrinomonadaceae bacterium]|nr:rhodanese-like domain-containing protein [Pyrinomonadaceae bacterium]
MRAAILLLLILALTGPAAPTACRREQSQNEGDPFAAIERVKPAEVANLVKEGRAVVVDIRDREAYEEEHIKGALSIPLEEVRERGPRELPADKLIVAYCA